MFNNKTIFVTGSAGFIGYNLSKKLLEAGNKIIGIDNFNDYYEVSLKKDRNNILKLVSSYKFYEGDICNIEVLKEIFSNNSIDVIVNLAAQAGVRYSLTNPFVYVDSNIKGFLNILECAKSFNIKSLIYASSSSVYGNNMVNASGFSEKDAVDHPISLYAATKKSNELMAYTYHHLYGINCTGLRFFTVYGPYGRPDMAYFKFAKSINEKKLIDVYNFGEMKRDFTYIDDIIDGICLSIEHNYEYEIFNLGNSNTVELKYFINCIEREMGVEAIKNYLPLQPGDVLETFADISHAKDKLGFMPKVKIDEGIKNFINWYKQYYDIK